MYLLVVALLALLECACHARPSLVPPQSVEMDAHTLKTFEEEVREYVRLRKHLLAGKVAPLASGANPEQVAGHQRELTKALVAHRQGEKRGEMFKPAVEQAIRRTLEREFAGPQGKDLIQGLAQGNPRVEGNPTPQNPSREVRQPFSLAVNAEYPAAAPLSSVPPTLLLKLPPLPDEVRYRFVGRALILRDTEANVILDFIPDVVPAPSIPR